MYLYWRGETNEIEKEASKSLFCQYRFSFEISQRHIDHTKQSKTILQNKNET